MNKEIKLENAPSNGTWVISWVGGVQKKNHEYSFDVAFYKVKNLSMLYKTDSFDFGTYKRRRLDSTFAPLIRVGSIWKNKRLIDYHDGFATDSIKRVTFSSDKSSEIKPLVELIDEPDDAYYPIPYHLRDAPCINVKADKKNSGQKIDLIIPCFEIARRYFFVNETLTSILIGHKGMFGELYIENQTGLKENKKTGKRKPFIKFGPAIYKRDIKTKLAKATIAEIAFNSVFRKAAARIGMKLYDYSIKKRSRYINTSLPFIDEVELLVKGKSFKCKSTGNWKYLVFEILSDNYQYMYNKYDYNLFIDKRSEKGIDRSKLKPTTSNRRKISNTNNAKEVVINLSTPSSHNSEETPIAIPEEDRNLPSFNRVEKKNQKTKAEHLVYPNRHADKFSTRIPGANGIDETVGKATLQLENENKDKFESPIIPTFEKVLNYMSKDGFSFNNIIMNEEYSPHAKLCYSIFPINLITATKAKNWCRKEYINGKGWKGFRRIAIAETEYYGRFFYFFEIEPRSKGESFYTAIISSSSGSKLGDSKVNIILKNLATIRGRWSKFEIGNEYYSLFSKSFLLETQCHFKTSTPEKLAQKFIHKMKKLSRDL